MRLERWAKRMLISAPLLFASEAAIAQDSRPPLIWENVIITAYVPFAPNAQQTGQCDSTCETTASGAQSKEGIAACPSSLPFGTKVEILESSGKGVGLILDCQDRGKLGSRHIDVLLESTDYREAYQYTAHDATVRVIFPSSEQQSKPFGTQTVKPTQTISELKVEVVEPDHCRETTVYETIPYRPGEIIGVEKVVCDEGFFSAGK